MIKKCLVVAALGLMVIAAGCDSGEKTQAPPSVYQGNTPSSKPQPGPGDRGGPASPPGPQPTPGQPGYPSR